MVAIFDRLHRTGRKDAAAPSIGAAGGLRVVIVPTDSHLSPQALADVVTDEALSARTRFVEVLVPAVLPQTLPIGAVPPRVAARLECLRETADTAIRSAQAYGRVEIVCCRSLPALIEATGGDDRLVLAGPAGWSLRRAARGLFAEIEVVPTRPRRRPSAIPVVLPNLSPPAGRP